MNGPLARAGGRVIRFLRHGFPADSADARRRQELARLAALPRFTPAATDLFGHSLEIVDSASFLWTYHEIFVNRIYQFAPGTPAPRIVDAGANIGLSVLFFKSTMPDARIVAFEPDPAIVPVLERNIAAAGVTGVHVEPYAVWSSATTLAFASDGADGGRVADARDLPTTRVPTVRLREYLDEPTELLKIDIEGAETEVLRDCEDRLDRVKRIYVEYHSFVDRPQTLHVLLGILARAGFRVQIGSVATLKQPFVARRENNGFDLQLHVFAMR